MAYRITYSWGSTDILPSHVLAQSAVDALRAIGRLENEGMKRLRIDALKGERAVRITVYRLMSLARAERGAMPLHARKTKARHAIASIFLGIIASALPNSFGDFGVVAASGGLRVARITRAPDRYRP